MLLKIAIIVLVVVAWFSSYKIWILNRPDRLAICEADIIYEPSSYLMMQGMWTKIVLEVIE